MKFSLPLRFKPLHRRTTSFELEQFLNLHETKGLGYNPTATGYTLLVAAFLIFTLFGFSLLSKLLVRLLEPIPANSPKPMSYYILELIGKDWYYMCLFPLTVPVFLVYIYFNWLGMKFFRHN